MPRKLRRNRSNGDTQLPLTPLTMAAEVEQIPLAAFAEKAYLDYSMYVILDRALPHLADGLKPVQRRIVYAMSELGLSAAAKFKKSARTVGDVLGKFHPHGDSACYEAMVLMAQPFSFRYPLVEGQGNWGSPDDPKSFAAMRYTEARLTAFAQLLLSELGQGTVEWVPNFDGTLEEPKLLPARLPHVLLNGASGIAVGMATDIPPHNVSEVAAALHPPARRPRGHDRRARRPSPGPRLPDRGRDHHAARRDPRHVRDRRRVGPPARPLGGRGGRGHRHRPPLPGLGGQGAAADRRPDAGEEAAHARGPARRVGPRESRPAWCSCRARTGSTSTALMAHLFATTDLEKSYRINLTMVGLNGRPRLFALRDLLDEWLAFRIETVRRRLKFRYDKVLARLHVLDGYLIAYLNVDEVIRIIRTEDEPKPVLMARFGLTDVQAEAILELKLRHLNRLEEVKIRGEQDELSRERDALARTLGSPEALRGRVREEIREDARAFGDARRSPIVERGAAKAMDEAALVPSEPVTVVISEKGWVRAAKGHDLDPKALQYRAGDAFLQAAKGRSNQLAIFLDSTGRSYSLPAHGFPSARGLGEPLSSQLAPPAGAAFRGVMMGDPEDVWLIANDAGYGFLVKLGDLVSKNRSGKAIMSVIGGATVLPPQRVVDPELDWIAVATTAGRLLFFPASEVPRLGKGKGVKLVNVPAKAAKEGEKVAGLTAIAEDGTVVVYAGKRYLNFKSSELNNYVGARAQRGRMLPRGFTAVVEVESS